MVQEYKGIKSPYQVKKGFGKSSPFNMHPEKIILNTNPGAERLKKCF